MSEWNTPSSYRWTPTITTGSSHISVNDLVLYGLMRPVAIAHGAVVLEMTGAGKWTYTLRSPPLPTHRRRVNGPVRLYQMRNAAARRAEAA